MGAARPLTNLGAWRLKAYVYVEGTLPILPHPLVAQRHEQQHQQAFLEQRRHLRNRPTSGFPGFKDIRRRKKLQRQDPSPELQRLLLRRVEAFKQPVGLTVIPSFCKVNPALIRDPKAFFKGKSARLQPMS